jgi:hypothetical protein
MWPTEATFWLKQRGLVTLMLSDFQSALVSLSVTAIMTLNLSLTQSESASESDILGFFVSVFVFLTIE